MMLGENERRAPIARHARARARMRGASESICQLLADRAAYKLDDRMSGASYCGLCRKAVDCNTRVRARAGGGGCSGETHPHRDALRGLESS